MSPRKDLSDLCSVPSVFLFSLNWLFYHIPPIQNLSEQQLRKPTPRSRPSPPLPGVWASGVTRLCALSVCLLGFFFLNFIIILHKGNMRWTNQNFIQIDVTQFLLQLYLICGHVTALQDLKHIVSSQSRSGYHHAHFWSRYLEICTVHRCCCCCRWPRTNALWGT